VCDPARDFAPDAFEKCKDIPIRTEMITKIRSTGYDAWSSGRDSVRLRPPLDLSWSQLGLDTGPTTPSNPDSILHGSAFERCDGLTLFWGQ